jgi:ABC-type spermidine/putrescine transport system permease subunit II
VLSHLILALPFSIIAVSNALEGFDKSIEEAAILCGASPWEARFRVTLPAIGHGLFAAAVFSFLVSWDEVVVAIFMASPIADAARQDMDDAAPGPDASDCRCLHLARAVYDRPDAAQPPRA